MKKLDRKQDFGTITGDDQGRVYEQNYTFFTADGSEWVDPSDNTKAATKADSKPAKAAAKTEAKADDQLAEQLK